MTPTVHMYRSGETGLFVNSLPDVDREIREKDDASGLAELSEEEANGVTRLMERYLPGAPLSWVIGAGAAAVAAELALANNPQGR
jgi:hypothetical protein